MTTITVHDPAPAELVVARVLAGRDTEREAWDALYGTLHPRPGTPVPPPSGARHPRPEGGSQNASRPAAPGTAVLRETPQQGRPGGPQGGAS
jgi:hypothetical protein